jgi:hypothetical protein
MLDVLNHLLDPGKGLLATAPVLRTNASVQRQLRDLQLKRASQRQVRACARASARPPPRPLTPPPPTQSK